MLKFNLKQKHLSFTEGWAMPELLMTNDKMEEDLLANLLKKDYLSDLDKAMKYVNTGEMAA